LHNCEIGESGALELAEMLTKNKALIRLILKSNPIGNDGCRALIASLRENNTLRVLNL
jgi:hypothetical protein